MEHVGLTAQVSAYIANRAEARLERFDKDAEKQRHATRDAGALAELNAALAIGRKEIATKYLPANWLADAAMRAKQIQMVTHALKFTHTDARGSNFYAPGGSQHPEGMAAHKVLSTASLAAPAIDAVGNAAALDVAAFLQLEHDGTALMQHIERGDPSPLQPFARDEQQLAEWLDGFRQVLTGSEPSSHNLAKQLYFPVAKGHYHLLAPLYSSSLAHALNSRVAATRYSDESKLIRKARKEGKYHPSPFVEYPNTAVKSYGGTKPQNVSQLNSSQGGKAFLLSCAPPNWKALAKPPLGVKSVFSRSHFGERVWKHVRSLQLYLVGLGDKKNKPIRDQRKERVDEILDQLVQYAAEIRNLAGHAGWSALPECRLSRAEQLWLDPWRSDMDEAFSLERAQDNWQERIADQFARWFNARLKHEKLAMGDKEYGEWKELALEVLD